MGQHLRERDARALGAVGTRHQNRMLSCRPSHRRCSDTHLSSSGEEPCVRFQAALGPRTALSSCPMVPAGLTQQQQQLRPSAPGQQARVVLVPPTRSQRTLSAAPFRVHLEALPSPATTTLFPNTQAIAKASVPTFSMLAGERRGVRRHRPPAPARTAAHGSPHTSCSSL